MAVVAIVALAIVARAVVRPATEPVLTLGEVVSDDGRAHRDHVPAGSIVHARSGVACFRFEQDVAACLDRGARARLVDGWRRAHVVELVEGRIALIAANGASEPIAVRTRAGRVVVSEGDVVVEVADEAGTSVRADVLRGGATAEPRVGLSKHVEAGFMAALGGDGRPLDVDEASRDRALVAAAPPAQ